jgi:GAF domain-containing protein
MNITPPQTPFERQLSPSQRFLAVVVTLMVAAFLVITAVTINNINQTTVSYQESSNRVASFSEIERTLLDLRILAQTAFIPTRPDIPTIIIQQVEVTNAINQAKELNLTPAESAGLARLEQDLTVLTDQLEVLRGPEMFIPDTIEQDVLNGLDIAIENYRTLSLGETDSFLQSVDATTQTQTITQITLFASAVLLLLLLGAFLASLRQSVSAEIARSNTLLEEERNRLQRRTAQFLTAAEIAAETGEILDLDLLLTQAANSISKAFNYYHTGIFLIDNLRDFAVLRAADSEGGQRMLARNHRLRVGRQGIVGSVAVSGRPRIARDVGADAAFFDNPDLPDTRAEMAIPIKIQGVVTGVLDVQSTDPEAFQEGDVEALQVLANQLGIAIQNTRLLRSNQESVQELERQVQSETETAWRAFSAKQSQAFTFDGTTVQRVQGVRELDKAHPHLLTVPLVVRGVRLGEIHLRRKPTDSPWSDDQREIANMAGGQIALALENVRLIEQTRAGAQRQVVIGEITNRIRQQNETESILRTTLLELSRSLNVSDLTLRMGLSDELLANTPANGEDAA